MFQRSLSLETIRPVSKYKRNMSISVPTEKVVFFIHFQVRVSFLGRLPPYNHSGPNPNPLKYIEWCFLDLTIVAMGGRRTASFVSSVACNDIE
jgi:hypothetical protein